MGSVKKKPDLEDLNEEYITKHERIRRSTSPTKRRVITSNPIKIVRR
jgi:hypothetical protein